MPKDARQNNTKWNTIVLDSHSKEHFGLEVYGKGTLVGHTAGIKEALKRMLVIQ